MSDVINWVIVLLGVIAVWYQWTAYRILKSPAFVVMALAMIYITVYRAALPFWPSMTDHGVVLPFFVLIVVHGVLMTSSLKSVLAATKNPGRRINPGVPRVWGRRHLDKVLVLALLISLIVVVALEVWEIFVVHSN